MRSCRRLQAIAVLVVVYTTDMKHTVHRIVGYIKRGFKFGSFVAIFRKFAKYNSMGVGVYGCIHVVAINMPSSAEVSTEGGPEVLHFLSKGDETGEGRTRPLFTSELGMKRNAICGAYSDYTPENRTKRETDNTRNVPARHFAVPKVGNNSEKAHIKYDGSHFVMSSAHGTQNLPNLNPTKCLSWQIL